MPSLHGDGQPLLGRGDGTAYGAGVQPLRQALALAAVFAFIGSVTVSVNVIDTYAHGLLTTASPVDAAAALLAAAVVTTIDLLQAPDLDNPDLYVHAVGRCTRRAPSHSRSRAASS